jgi:hypothetical protein
MTDRDASLEAAFAGEGATLRLLWPHWHTIAEFFPRQVMHLQRLVDGFPLISADPAR